MDFLPAKPIFDEVLYSEQMDSVLSETARKTKAVLQPPRKKFDREKFLCAIDEAFELIGGVPRLALWADQNPTEFYRLYGKTLPQTNLIDLAAKMQMQILPALPPSALDEPIDITPERKDGPAKD
jgi:hypothetical protein